ncbi:Receptor-like serine/threonine-protein [Vigna angularis]|uniref:Receptor-like serine/threonine-protein n=1 Tax=Phaseolus angularis TaxID=3914 RepID=A0A8T0KS93_PHAAN|nr:Receptor-like serine/threonine-protein [Vigna angularis]
MEVNTTATVPAGPPAKNHSFTQHRLHSERHRHSHGHFPTKTILITVSFVTLVTVLFVIFVVLFLIRRQKSSSKSGTCKEDRTELHDTSSRLITSSTLNSSPEVKSGCLHGGNLGRTPAPTFRGVQVFTYRELEIATDGFSERNVIGGNGGHGLMYRGVLSDGTLAAIKLLRSEGKQGERAFRIESEYYKCPISSVIWKRPALSSFSNQSQYATGKLTTKSDVYSYGVVLLELLTGRVPVDIKRAQGEHVLVSWALPRLTNREKVIEMVDPALRGQYSKKDLIQIAAIAAMCIQPEADYRPLMTDVVQSLIPLVRNPSSLSSSSLRFQKQTPKSRSSLEIN